MWPYNCFWNQKEYLRLSDLRTALLLIPARGSMPSSSFLGFIIVLCRNKIQSQDVTVLHFQILNLSLLIQDGTWDCLRQWETWAQVTALLDSEFSNLLWIVGQYFTYSGRGRIPLVLHWLCSDCSRSFLALGKCLILKKKKNPKQVPCFWDSGCWYHLSGHSKTEQPSRPGSGLGTQDYSVSAFVSLPTFFILSDS